MQSRRAALITLAAGTVSPLLAQHTGHDVSDTANAQPRDPVFFNQGDYATVSRLADLILPRTDTPGAVDANVPYRIDHEVSVNPHLQSEFSNGLAFRAKSANNAGSSTFVELPEEQQLAILSDMNESPDTPGGQFFKTAKELTVDWYYRSEEGLVKELGFHGNTFRPNFPGCNHPEHWPAEAAVTQERK